MILSCGSNIRENWDITLGVGSKDIYLIFYFSRYKNEVVQRMKFIYYLSSFCPSILIPLFPNTEKKKKKKKRKKENNNNNNNNNNNSNRYKIFLAYYLPINMDTRVMTINFFISFSFLFFLDTYKFQTFFFNQEYPKLVILEIYGWYLFFSIAVKDGKVNNIP